MKQQEWDQEGRKGLREGLSGRKKPRRTGRDGVVIPRSQSLVPAPTAGKSRAEGRGGGEKTIKYMALIKALKVGGQ